MLERAYKRWLEAEKYDSGTITAQLHRSGRVEKHYGSLDQHYKNDRLANVLSSLVYSTEDERRMRPNPSKIPLDAKANIRNNLASYRSAVMWYRRFLESGGNSDYGEGGDEGEREVVDLPVAAAVEVLTDKLDEGSQRIGLERDMQRTLRLAISDLEDGLEIIDDGIERIVESGRIDITARDSSGSTVVIELKAGTANQRAIAQILSYMGDVADEEPGGNVRGFLIAADFDNKARAAAKMVPTLKLVSYSVKFFFKNA